MWNHLYRLQKKPEHVRRKILLVSTCVLTAGIIGAWLAVVGPYWDTGMTAPEQEASSASAPAPFAAMKDTFAQFFSDAAVAIDMLKGVASTSNAVIEATTATNTVQIR